MAIKSIVVGSTMVLKIKSGVDENGKDIIKKQAFGKLTLNAKDEDIFEIAEAVKAVCEYPIVDIRKELACSVISE